MTFRLFQNFTFLLLGLLIAGTSVQAQESVPPKEKFNVLPDNLIEVEVETFQSEALKNFLQEYRLIWQQSRFDTSNVLKKHRDDFSNLKKENLQALKSISKNRLPKVVLKRIHPPKDQTPQSAPKPTPPPSLGPDFIFHGVLAKQNLNKRPQAQKKDKHLSLIERQRLAEIKKLRSNESLHLRQSELGRLQTEIEQGPLKEHQAKLAEFSNRIKKLLGEIRNRRGDEQTIFLELGNAYLESQRFLDSLDSQDRLKLTNYASHSRVTLGSYEQALWTFKMALSRNPNDGDTNFLMGKIFSEIGNTNEALERAKNAEYLFAKNHELERAAETRSFIDSLVNTPPKNYKTNF
jgi:tetratricopeptide (TPR) repeat protein